jgi:hypothetical protein
MRSTSQANPDMYRIICGSSEDTASPILNIEFLNYKKNRLPSVTVKSVEMEAQAVEAMKPEVVAAPMEVAAKVPDEAPTVAAVDAPMAVVDEVMPVMPVRPKRGKPMCRRIAEEIYKRQHAKMSIENQLFKWRSWCWLDCAECPQTIGMLLRHKARHPKLNDDGGADCMFYSCVLQIDIGSHKAGDRVHHIEWRPSASTFTIYPNRSNQRGELFYLNSSAARANLEVEAPAAPEVVVPPSTPVDDIPAVPTAVATEAAPAVVA